MARKSIVMEFAAGIAAAIILLAPSIGHADCEIDGTIVSVSGKQGNSKTKHTIWLREQNLDSHVYRVTTKNEDLLSMAASLAASHSRVKVIGNQRRCPQFGFSRNMGTLKELVVNP